MGYKLRRKVLSQNFLYNRTLIKNLVRLSSVGREDTVLEIGPGKGFITSQLLLVAKKVIAVDIDAKLILHLQKFFPNNPKLDLHLANILEFPLPKTNYKVFANIPFSIEGKIIRKLTDAKNPPQDCYLIIRQDLAQRLSGKFKESQFSLTHKPWFDFDIVYYFKRSDFIPQPKVDSVLWRVWQKKNPLLPATEKLAFQQFIEVAFGQGMPIKQNLKRILTSAQLNLIQHQVSFPLKIKPGYLTLNQWLKLYKYANFYA